MALKELIKIIVVSLMLTILPLFLVFYVGGDLARTPGEAGVGLYKGNGHDGIDCDDTIKKLSNMRLHQLIKSNNINILRLSELLGTSVDSYYVNLPRQIEIFMGQNDCANMELSKRLGEKNER